MVEETDEVVAYNFSQTKGQRHLHHMWHSGSTRCRVTICLSSYPTPKVTAFTVSPTLRSLPLVTQWCQRGGFPGGSLVMDLPVKQETQVQSQGQEDPLEKDMATHFSILTWEIPWTDESGGLQSKKSQRFRYNLAIKQQQHPCDGWNTKDKCALPSGNLLFFKVCSSFTNLARY